MNRAVLPAATVSVAALSVAAVLAGCGPAISPPSLAVFAAASLKTAFTTLGQAFSDGDPAVRVELSVAGSADLLTQLMHGAPADVFASADTATMAKADAAGLLAGPPTAFASNTLIIAVAPGNPIAIKGFHDLHRVSVVVCAVRVPCGSALPGLERETGTHLDPVSEESSVSDVLTKVTSGQADAGLVYRTDALAAGDTVSTVPFPEAAGAVNTYQIAVLKGARAAGPAHRFVDLVNGPAGQQVLGAAGFGRAGAGAGIPSRP